MEMRGETVNGPGTTAGMNTAAALAAADNIGAAHTAAAATDTHTAIRVTPFDSEILQKTSPKCPQGPTGGHVRNRLSNTAQ